MRTTEYGVQVRLEIQSAQDHPFLVVWWSGTQIEGSSSRELPQLGEALDIHVLLGKADTGPTEVVRHGHP